MARVARDLLAEITAQRSKIERERAVAAAAELALHGLIRAAIKAEHSVSEIAQAAGLSRERIYQIRDGRR